MKPDYSRYAVYTAPQLGCWTNTHRCTFPLCAWGGTSEDFLSCGFLNLQSLRRGVFKPRERGIQAQALGSGQCLTLSSSERNMMPGLQQECDTGCEWSLFCVFYRIKLSLLLEGVLWEPESLGCFISIASAKIKGFTPFSSPVPLPRAESSYGWAFWGTK